MNGILNVNKTPGMTSFDVVSKVRRLAGTKKAGHAGTLDPDAGGVLPVCVGKATKVIEFLMDKDKAYRVGLTLGAATDTQDSSGNVLYEKPVLASESEIEQAVLSFVGCREQVPPMYSAVKIQGKKLYELARKGVEVERAARPVTFYEIRILSMDRVSDKVKVLLDVTCSKGTYMRTLCHDIGEKLNCGGFMDSLIRTRSGPFRLEASHTLDKLNDLKQEGKLHEAMIPMDRALEHLSAASLSEQDAKRLQNGLPVYVQANGSGLIRVYDRNKRFIAIGEAMPKDGRTLLKPYKWLGSD